MRALFLRLSFEEFQCFRSLPHRVVFLAQTRIFMDMAASF